VAEQQRGSGRKKEGRLLDVFGINIGNTISFAIQIISKQMVSQVQDGLPSSVG
jgi:hypothetical protein